MGATIDSTVAVYLHGTVREEPGVGDKVPTGQADAVTFAPQPSFRRGAARRKLMTIADLGPSALPSGSLPL